MNNLTCFPPRAVVPSGPINSPEAISAYCRAITGEVLRGLVTPPAAVAPRPAPPPPAVSLASAVPYVDVPLVARDVVVSGASRAVLFELRQQRSWDRVLAVLSGHLPHVHEAVFVAVRKAGTQDTQTSHVETHGTVVRVACVEDEAPTPMSFTPMGLTAVACSLGATCTEDKGECSVGFGPLRCDATELLDVTPEDAPILAECVEAFIDEPVAVVGLSVDEQSVLPQLRGNIDVTFPPAGDVRLVIMTNVDGFRVGPRERFERQRLIEWCRNWSPPRHIGRDADLIRLALWKAAPCDWPLLGVLPLSLRPPPAPDCVTETLAPDDEPTVVADAEPCSVPPEGESVPGLPPLVDPDSIVPCDVVEALSRSFGDREVEIICRDVEESVTALVGDISTGWKEQSERPGYFTTPACAAPLDSNPRAARHFIRGGGLLGQWRGATLADGADLLGVVSSRARRTF